MIAVGKIEDKKKQKKEALLVSAMELFTEKGIEEESRRILIGLKQLLNFLSGNFIFRVMELIKMGTMV